MILDYEGTEDYKYNEDSVVTAFIQYLDKTYSLHYTNDENDLQVLDIWKARGSLTNTAIDTAIKYLMRYGKKDGHNVNDLYKAMHYIVLSIGNDDEWVTPESLENEQENYYYVDGEEVNENVWRHAKLSKNGKHSKLSKKVGDDAYDVYKKFEMKGP